MTSTITPKPTVHKVSICYSQFLFLDVEVGTAVGLSQFIGSFTRVHALVCLHDVIQLKLVLISSMQEHDTICLLEFKNYIDGLAQDSSNFSALTMQLLQTCTEPSIYDGKENPKYCNLYIYMYVLAHTEPLFSELNILKVSNLYNYSIALFMYKLNCSKLPDIFPMFVYNHEIHKYETRQSDHFHIPTCRTNLSKMSIKYQGPIIWNELSSNIDIDCSIGTFKKRAKRYISGGQV